MRPSPLAALAFFWLSTALAQTASIDQVDLSRGLTLPPTGTALIDNATSPSVNPAGLTFLGGGELQYLHERNLAVNSTDDALFLATTLGGHFSLGFGEEWLRPQGAVPHYRRTTWALSLGGQFLSLGGALHLYSSDQPNLDRINSFDLGVTSRPARWLSLGATFQNLDNRTEGALTFGRAYDFGIGVRPVGERFTLGVDWLFSEAAGTDNSIVQGTLSLGILPGLTLGAGVAKGFGLNSEWRLQLGLTVDGSHAGLTYAGGGTSNGADHIIALRVSSAAYTPLSFGEGKLALFDLEDLLQPAGGIGALLGFPHSDPYIRLTEQLDRAARDPQLAGVVLKVNGLPGVSTGKAEELRQAVLRLRASGKRVIAVVLSADDPAYLAISSSDRIATVPQAMLAVNGLQMSSIFLGDLMSGLGVKWDVARVGAFKNAPDALTRNSMSPEQKEAAQAFLDANVQQFDSAVTQARRISVGELNSALDEGLIPTADAKAKHLVDDVVSPAQLSEELDKLVPGTAYDPYYLSENKRDIRWGTRRRIAIVPIIGDITGGKSRSAPTGGEVAGAETVVLALKRAASDPLVSAIVLRIDSPGGDGLASDLIYREVLEAKKHKPVIASMGDIAASGGYYSAMGADEIYALPTTLTGSIGVFVLKPGFQGLGEKLGVKLETIKDRPLSDIFGFYKPWSPEEQKAAQHWVDAFYDDFITGVAASRNLPKTQVDAVARGRIWAGSDALKHGLVDKMGGLLDAIDEARRKAGISPGEQVELAEYGAPRGLFSGMGGEEGVLAKLLSATFPVTLPESGFDTLARSLGVDPWLLQNPGVLARLPYNVTLK